MQIKIACTSKLSGGIYLMLQASIVASFHIPRQRWHCWLSCLPLSACSVHLSGVSASGIAVLPADIGHMTARLLSAPTGLALVLNFDGCYRYQFIALMLHVSPSISCPAYSCHAHHCHSPNSHRHSCPQLILLPLYLTAWLLNLHAAGTSL